MNRIKQDMNELKCILTPTCTSFYYKLNTPVNNNGYLQVSLDGLIEGEIGYTNNSIQQRHPKANIQFIQHINSDGRVIHKGSKIAVEKAVIENIKHLPYIQFGNDTKPNSTEIFRFPYEHLQEVREKIDNIVVRYIARDNLFKINYD